MTNQRGYIGVINHKNENKLIVQENLPVPSKIGTYVLPLKVPHVLAAERWVISLDVKPFIDEIDREPRQYFDGVDEAVCENCKDMYYLGESLNPDVMDENVLSTVQKEHSVCSEECALEYIFTFSDKDVQYLKDNYDQLTNFERLSE